VATLGLGVAACGGRRVEGGGRAAEVEATGAAVTVSVPVPVPVRTDDVVVQGDLNAFVVRGGRVDAGAGRPMVFVPGMCVHPRDYMLTFQGAAGARGDLLGVQGDVSCGGNGYARRWSGDLGAMDRRIVAAFRAAGLGEPRDVTLIGYSQGAERAEKLLARFPERYARAVLIASPIAPSPRSFQGSPAVVLMAGSLDPFGVRTMREGERAFAGAKGTAGRGKPAVTFITLPGARHGQMGDRPEETMGAALDAALR